jgi:hypothetical protein
MSTQVVGKIKLALNPMVNHSLLGQLRWMGP